MGKEKKEKEFVDDKFSKENLLSANIFKNRKDILSVLIKDDEELSIKETQERMNKFMKGKVK